MMMKRRNVTRRDFLKTSLGAGTVALASGVLGWNYAWAQGSDRIRVGVIGCGGRGTGAARDAVNAAPNVEIWALGDLFQDRAEGAFNSLQNLGDRFKVTRERVFWGFDNYLKVIHSGVDMVILADAAGLSPHPSQSGGGGGQARVYGEARRRLPHWGAYGAGSRQSGKAKGAGRGGWYAAQAPERLH
jgi:hypothetical protein